MSKFRVLFLGDIVGRPGRDAIATKLPRLREIYQPDFVVANVENAASGFGLTDRIYRDFQTLGIHAFTGGNHIYDKREFVADFDQYTLLVRPVNFPPGQPGEGFRYFQVGSLTIAVVSLIGRVFMAPSDCPFRKMDEILPEILQRTKIVFVDFHAEASSEKQAMGWYLDGRVSAVLGTHTHVPTADARVLPAGTAFQTDVGMAGATNGILGMERTTILNRFLNQMPTRFSPPETSDVTLSGAVFDVDPETGKALNIVSISDSFVLDDENG